MRAARIRTVLAGFATGCAILACGGDVRNFRDLDDIPADFPLEVDAYKVTAACASRSSPQGPVMGHQVLAEPRFETTAERDEQVTRWAAALEADGWTVRSGELYFGRDDDQLDIDPLGTSVYLTWWTPGCDHEDGELLDD